MPVSQFILSQCHNAPIVQWYDFLPDVFMNHCTACGRIVGTPTGEDLWCFEQALLPVDVETPETAWQPTGLLGALKDTTQEDPQSED